MVSYHNDPAPCSAAVSGSSSDSTGAEQARRRAARDTHTVRRGQAIRRQDEPGNASPRFPCEGFPRRFRVGAAHVGSAVLKSTVGRTRTDEKSLRADFDGRRKMITGAMTRSEMIEGWAAAAHRLAYAAEVIRTCTRNRWFAG